MVFRRFFHPRHFNQLRNYCGRKTDSKSPNIDSFKTKPDTFSRLGDDGTSKIINGDVLPKDSQIFNAIGATEELLSYLGLAREHGQQSEHEYTDKLKRIQTIIIDISTAISRSNKSTIPLAYTKELEDWIHEYSKQLPAPEQYIIPGGGVASASLHVARAICRKTERIIVPLVRQGTLDKEAQIYLNRLSDFLFTISRVAAKQDQRVESIYIPKPDEKIQAQVLCLLREK
nr:cob(I)yrinic acid a,c-diamide adenosyltransferase, mitochondrial-like isoform X1 [Leptinotarsa decemlineata]